MTNIFVERSPNEINDQLLEKWEISLFRFAQVYAVSPIEIFIQGSYYPFTAREIKEIKHILKEMQSNLYKGARRIREITGKLLEAPAKGISDDELAEEMQLKGFFKKYVHKYELLARYVEKTSLQGKRGVRINKKSIIAVGWGNLVSQANRRIDWKTLGELYDWFWKRVGPYDFYADIKPVYGIEEYLRHQYNDHRWVGGAGNYIISKLRIAEEEVPTFLSNFLVQRLVEGKEDYFRDKLPMTKDKFRQLFQNIFIDFYLGEREGLTLFSKNQSLADPMFLFMLIWLGKAIGKGLFPDLDGESKTIAGTLSKAEMEMPYKGTQIGDYMNCAIQFYINHKVKLAEIPPLIIFPDKSPFSICF